MQVILVGSLVRMAVQHSSNSTMVLEDSGSSIAIPRNLEHRVILQKVHEEIEVRYNNIVVVLLEEVSSLELPSEITIEVETPLDVVIRVEITVIDPIVVMGVSLVVHNLLL